MSRTFRRKNFEDTQRNSWDNKGRKTNGFYTTSDYEYYQKDGGDCWIWGRTEEFFRPMSEQERNHEYKRIHGESRSKNAWTPSRWFRQNREIELRSHNKQELIKYMKDPDNYEPMVFENPKSHMWDWS
jgi:hypothetical protein